MYSGDTTPSWFMIESGQNADLLVHETFNSLKQPMERSGYPERRARAIGTIVHSDR